MAILLSNAFIFYGFGYDALTSGDPGVNSTGLFTIINAAIHFGVSQLIRTKLADRALYYLVFGLTVVFITIAIPVQFDGNWVTLLWTAEGALIFFIGRTKGLPAYEKLSGVLLLLGLVSLGEDWIRYGEQFEYTGNNIGPFANIMFVSGLLVAVVAGGMLWLARNKKYAASTLTNDLFRNYYTYILAIIFLLVSYLTFYLEIQAVFSPPLMSLPFVPFTNPYLFGRIVMLLYSMIFTSIVIYINQRWVKSREMNTVSLAGAGLMALILLVSGLNLLNTIAE